MASKLKVPQRIAVREDASAYKPTSSVNDGISVLIINLKIVVLSGSCYLTVTLLLHEMDKLCFALAVRNAV